MTVYEIVRKLIGPIHPIGSHSRDLDERLPALVNTENLINELLVNVVDVATSKDAEADSIRRVGMRADTFLNQLREYLEEVTK